MLLSNKITTIVQKVKAINKIIYKFWLKMSVSTTKEKKCRVIQVMKDIGMSTSYTISLFCIPAEEATGSLRFLVKSLGKNCVWNVPNYEFLSLQILFDQSFSL